MKEEIEVFSREVSESPVDPVAGSVVSRYVFGSSDIGAMQALCSKLDPFTPPTLKIGLSIDTSEPYDSYDLSLNLQIKSRLTDNEYTLMPMQRGATSFYIAAEYQLPDWLDIGDENNATSYEYKITFDNDISGDVNISGAVILNVLKTVYSKINYNPYALFSGPLRLIPEFEFVPKDNSRTTEFENLTTLENSLNNNLVQFLHNHKFKEITLDAQVIKQGYRYFNLTYDKHAGEGSELINAVGDDSSLYTLAFVAYDKVNNSNQLEPVYIPGSKLVINDTSYETTGLTMLPYKDIITETNEPKAYAYGLYPRGSFGSYQGFDFMNPQIHLFVVCAGREVNEMRARFELCLH